MLFMLLVVLCFFSRKSSSKGMRGLGIVLVFALVNGVLAVILGPWPPALLYASVLIFELLRAAGILNTTSRLEKSNGTKRGTGDTGAAGERASGRPRFFDGAG
jgi:hypothetical protein